MGHPSIHQHPLSLSPSLVIISREQGQSSTLALLHLDLVPPPLPLPPPPPLPRFIKKLGLYGRTLKSLIKEDGKEEDGGMTLFWWTVDVAYRGS